MRCSPWCLQMESGPIEPADQPREPGRGYLKGFSALLPVDGSFEGAYSMAAEDAGFVSTWVGKEGSGYWDLADYLGGWWGDTFVNGLTRANGMLPIINLSFIDREPSTGQLVLSQPAGTDYAGLADPAFRAAYSGAALAAVATIQPAFLSLGNEVNRWYELYGAGENDPNGFQHFVSLYEETYDAVKRVSPQTTFFCISSREIVDQNRQADMSVLRMLDPPKLDVVVFTSYPFAVQGFNLPSDVPDNYHSSSVLVDAGLEGKPFGFTELGWSSLPDFGGEEGQAEFLRNVTGRLTKGQGLDLHLLGWWSLCDLEGAPHRSGLLSNDGRERNQPTRSGRGCSLIQREGGNPHTHRLVAGVGRQGLSEGTRPVGPANTSGRPEAARFFLTGARVWQRYAAAHGKTAGLSQIERGEGSKEPSPPCAHSTATAV